MRVLLYVLVFAAFMLVASEMLAQCPMCRMSVQSNLEDGGSAGKTLNTGILYLLATPYLAFGILGYLWWRNRIKNPEDEAELAFEDAVDDIDADKDR